MPIYRKTFPDIGGKMSNMGMNIFSMMQGIPAMAGAKEAQAAATAAKQAEAAAIAEEAARAQQSYLGKAYVPRQAQSIYNAPSIPGDLFTNAEAGMYPMNDMMRAGVFNAAFPNGGVKEYMAAFPQAQQDVGVTRAMATPTGQNVVGTSALSKMFNEATKMAGVMDPRSGQYSLYSQGGPEVSWENVNYPGIGPMPKEVKRNVPPGLIPAMDFGVDKGLTSEGTIVDKVSEEDMAEAIASKMPVEEQGPKPMQGPPLPPELVTSPSGLNVTVQPKPTVDLRAIIADFIKKLYGTGQYPMYTP